MNDIQRDMEVFLVYLDISKCPVKFKVTVPEEGTIKDLCDILSKIANVDTDANRLVVTEVLNNRFFHIYNDDDSLSQIQDFDDIFVYEILNENNDQLIIRVYFRDKTSDNLYNFDPNLFGRPFMMSLPKEFAYKFLYDKILESMPRFVSGPLFLRSNLFHIAIVDASGGDTMGGGLKPTDGKIKLENEDFLALDWDAFSKSVYYDEELAEEYAEDHSILCKISSKLDCPECPEYLKAMEMAQNTQRDLEKLVAPEVQKLEKKFEKTLENLKLSKEKDRELKSLEEKYARMLKNVEDNNEKKEDCERRAYLNEKRVIENNLRSVKNDFLKVICTHTGILKKSEMEKPNEPDADVQKAMECPVCLDEIFQCTFGHLICETCKGKLGTPGLGQPRPKCPTCKVSGIMGRATAVEKLARALYGKK